MKKFLIPIAIAFTLLISACAGQDASKADLKEPKQHGRSLPTSYEARVPDKLIVWQNTDGQPTVNELCLDGVAFATTSRDLNSLIRVEKWDEKCPKTKVGS